MFGAIMINALFMLLLVLRVKHSGRALAFMAIGITLFFLCDAFISVRVLRPSDTAAYAFVRFMVWVFYIPPGISFGKLSCRQTRVLSCSLGRVRS